MQISKYVGDILVVALRGLNGWHRNGFFTAPLLSVTDKNSRRIYILYCYTT